MELAVGDHSSHLQKYINYEQHGPYQHLHANCSSSIGFLPFVIVLQARGHTSTAGKQRRGGQAAEWSLHTTEELISQVRHHQLQLRYVGMQAFKSLLRISG